MATEAPVEMMEDLQSASKDASIGLTPSALPDAPDALSTSPQTLSQPQTANSTDETVNGAVGNPTDDQQESIPSITDSDAPVVSCPVQAPEPVEITQLEVPLVGDTPLIEADKAVEASNPVPQETLNSAVTAGDISSNDSDSDSSDDEDVDEFRKSLLMKGVKEEGVKSNVFDAEDSDDDFDQDIQSRVNNMIETALEEEGPSSTGPPRTMNEADYGDDHSLPATAPSSSDLVLAGRISVVLPNDILVVSADHTKTWDVESVLCLKDGTILGRISELIGRVDRPSYRIFIETSAPQATRGKKGDNKAKGRQNQQNKSNKPTNPPADLEKAEPIKTLEITDDTAEQGIQVTERMALDGGEEVSVNAALNALANPEIPSQSTNEAPEATTIASESVPTASESEMESSSLPATTDAPAPENLTAMDITPSETSETVSLEVSAAIQAATAANEFYARRKALKARLAVGDIVLCVVDLSREVNSSVIRSKGSDASNVWDEEVGDDEMDFSDDEEEQRHKKRVKEDRKTARANGLEPNPRGRGAKRAGGAQATKVEPSGVPAPQSSSSDTPAIAQRDSSDPSSLSEAPEAKRPKMSEEEQV